jgi:hypothetical protein
MEIKYKNYTAKEADGRFDLYVTKKLKAKADTKNLKQGEEYDFEDCLGYGFSFESMALRIISYEIAENNDVLTIQEYIEQFKKIKEEVFNVLK